MKILKTTVGITPAKPGSGAEEWLSLGRFALVLGVFLVACFPQIVLGLEAFAGGDCGCYAYPVAYYFRESLRQGEVPLWNPLSSCGIPFLAQWNTMVLYPPGLLLVALPMPWAYGIFCLAHMFWAGLGMYGLAYRWTSHRLAAAVAGAAFAFNGLMWSSVMWPHLLAAMAWMPWVVLSLERGWREGGRHLAYAALAGAMQVLSGGAEAVLQTWLVLGALWLADWAGGGREPKSAVQPAESVCPSHPTAAASVPAETEPGRRWRVAWRAGLIGLWVAGLAAAQLLPFMALLQSSQRNSYYGHLGTATVSAMPWNGAANFLAPLFHCQPEAEGMYHQPDQFWLPSYYLGIGIVALAAVAVWRVRQRRVWLLAGIALFGLLLAMGEHGGIYPWVRAAVPGIRLVRFQVKFVMMVSFALPLLAAYGLSGCLRLPASQWAAGKKALLGLSLGLLALMGLIVCAAWKFPLYPTEGLTVSGNTGLRAVFLLLVLGAVTFLKSGMEQRTGRILQIGLLGLLWFDIFTHGPRLSPTVPALDWQPNMTRQAFRWNEVLLPGNARAMQSPDVLWQLVKNGSGSTDLDTKVRRLTLFMNNNLLDGVPKIDGFYSSDIRQYFDVYGWLYFKTNSAEGLKDFLGVAYVAHLTDGVEWAKRPSALPLVTAGQQPEFRDELGTLKAISGDSFDPRRTVYLPESARGQITCNGSAHARVLSGQFATHSLEVAVEADAPALVVVAQSFYPCWRAYVDGQPSRLWRANHAFQAVEIPAGKHQVALIYEDNAFRWGVGLSLLSLIGCGAWLWICSGARPLPGSRRP